ncbi:hypothetical protein HDU88_004661 [Geranomyces variabilis]|nr:hypothetical protein HDU88_004661 [Geranomyces variabilis]
MTVSCPRLLGSSAVQLKLTQSHLIPVLPKDSPPLSRPPPSRTTTREHQQPTSPSPRSLHADSVSLLTLSERHQQYSASLRQQQQRLYQDMMSRGASDDMDQESPSEQRMHQPRELRHEQQQQQSSQPRYQQRPPSAPELRLAREAPWNVGLSHGASSFAPEYLRRSNWYEHVLEPNPAPPPERIPHQAPPYPPHLQIKQVRRQLPSNEILPDDPTTLAALAALHHQQAIDNLRLKERQVLEQKQQDERHTQQELNCIREFARRRSQPREAEEQPDGAGSADVSESSGDNSPLQENPEQESIAHYELVVRQQPQRARMSGYNHKDRRPVDPPPIDGQIEQTCDLGPPVLHSYGHQYSSGSDAFLPHNLSYASSSADLPPRVPEPEPQQQQQQQQEQQQEQRQQQQQYQTFRQQEQQHASPTESSPHTERRTSDSFFGDSSVASASVGGPSPTDLRRPSSSDLHAPSSIDLQPPSPTGSHQSTGDAYLPPLSFPILLGSLVSACHILRGEDGVKGLYFVFPNIGLRTSGRFRLKFSLFIIETFDKAGNSNSPPSSAGAPNSATTKSPYPTPSHTSRASVFSNPFQVYSPKRFPGMAASTALSRLFAQQGIRIHLRDNAHTQRAKEFAERKALARRKSDGSII